MLSGYTPDGEGLYPENPIHAPLNPYNETENIPNTHT